METEEDPGIFLFKNSKIKISTETIFVEEVKKEETTKVSKDFINGKWMKRFLNRFLRPSLLHTPIPALTSEEIVSESKKLPPFKDAQSEVVEWKNQNARKVTRGNRRHKIKTRRQRRQKCSLKLSK